MNEGCFQRPEGCPLLLLEAITSIGCLIKLDSQVEDEEIWKTLSIMPDAEFLIRMEKIVQKKKKTDQKLKIW